MGNKHKGETVEKKLTKAEMRVAVAKDVIAQIKAGRYEVQTGAYFNISERVSDFFRGLFGLGIKDVGKEQMKDYMKEITAEPCTVCAKGAAFLSYVKLFNKTPMSRIFDGDGDFFGDADPTDNGFDLFGDKAEMMEAAFEGDDINGVLSEAALEKALDFNARYGDAESRLIAIMKNVIKNNGTFKP